MALTAAQIVDLATQMAKVPGYTTQALAFLNSILQELAQDYDFDVIRKSAYFTFTTTGAGNGYAAGSGPNAMPADFLRLHRNGSFYLISQVPYQLIGVKQEEFDTFVQQPGLASYPYFAYVDVSAASSQEPGLYVWPPAAGAYPATIRYNPQPAAITDTSAVPWFPNSTYLYTRVAGELMKITNDDRWQAFLSDQEGSGGAGDLLTKYLKMKDDPETAVHRVTLDRRFFGNTLNNLRNTKTIGWLLLLGFVALFTGASHANSCPPERPIARQVVDYTVPVTCTLVACLGILTCPPEGACYLIPNDCNKCTKLVVYEKCFTQQEIDEAQKVK